MTRRLQRGRDVKALPLWQRFLVLASLLLVTVVGSAQAAHVHGQWLPHTAAHANQQPDASQVATHEDHCALCVAMHAPMLAPSMVLAAEPVLVKSFVVVEAPTPKLTATLAFASFSRPPPAQLV